METLRTILTIIYILDCVALTVVVLMQEGKQQGLGALSGSNSETFWSKNKGRSREGKLKTATTVMAVLFMLLAIVLNLKFLA